MTVTIYEQRNSGVTVIAELEAESVEAAYAVARESVAVSPGACLGVCVGPAPDDRVRRLLYDPSASGPESGYAKYRAAHGASIAKMRAYMRERRAQA